MTEDVCPGCGERCEPRPDWLEIGPVLKRGSVIHFPIMHNPTLSNLQVRTSDTPVCYATWDYGVREGRWLN